MKHQYTINTRQKSADQSQDTPLMKQYNQIKTTYPGAMLLFRVGDFYEIFGEDAITLPKSSLMGTDAVLRRKSSLLLHAML